MTSYTYSISQDCPEGKINTAKLQVAIQQSSIAVALDHIDTNDDELIIYFKATLSGTEQATLDGNAGTPYNTHPAGGLIASTDTSKTQIALPLLTANIKPSGCYERRYGFSPNFCDPTTWWEQAIKITNETVATGDGATTTFQLAHGNGGVSGEAILDLQHGKITEEDFLTPPGETAGGYNITVTVGGAAKTHRECFESSGGNYTFDYLNGQITFFEAPTNGAAIICTYWYVPNNVGPTFTMAPGTGKQLIIDDAECSFSSDIEMLDTMYSGAWLKDYAMWAPIDRNPTPYKTISDYYNYTYGAYPILPAIGTNARGYNQSNATLRWDFKSYIIFTAGDAGAPCFRMTTKHNRKPFSGLSATITIYAIEVTLANKLI